MCNHKTLADTSIRRFLKEVRISLKNLGIAIEEGKSHGKQYFYGIALNEETKKRNSHFFRWLQEIYINLYYIGEIHLLKSISIARNKLKEYIPTFTPTTTIGSEITVDVDNTSTKTSESYDRNLVPIIKLLHAVFIHQES